LLDMTSSIDSRGTILHFANTRFCNLIEWALEVSVELHDPNAEAYRARLAYEYENVFAPSNGWPLDDYLKSGDEAAFWARAFVLVAARIFERRLGNQDHPSTAWQPSAIADAWSIAQVLTDHVPRGSLPVVDVVAWAIDPRGT
jgi:hypothetical protein